MRDVQRSNSSFVLSMHRRNFDVGTYLLSLDVLTTLPLTYFY